MADSIKETEYGVRYLNGTEDWETRRWFGHIETPEMRASFEEQYDLRMSGMGAPKLPLVFLTRTKTTSYSDAAVIDDTAPEPAPDPVPVPGEEPAPLPAEEELPPESDPDPVPAEEEPAPAQPAEGNDPITEGAEHGTKQG